MERKVLFSRLPWGVWAVEKLNLCGLKPLLRYKILIVFLTYCSYTCYHLSRKPFSVVTIALCPVCANCSFAEKGEEVGPPSNVTPGWAPFNNEHLGRTLLGSVDLSLLFAYAISLYFSGFLADRINLRIFIFVGMLGSGLSVCLLGLAYFGSIHELSYFLVVQVLGGVMQSTGLPGNVAVMSNWFGKQNRGLIMGMWNSHTSLGNILGAILPSFWARCNTEDSPWGWSFILPGAIIIAWAFVIYLFLINDPTYVGLSPPMHHLAEDLRELALSGAQDPSAGSTSNGLSGGDPQERSSSFPLQESGEREANEAASQSEDELAGEEGDRAALLKADHAAQQARPKAINFFRALMIPGVVEFAFALYFNKLVSYTFLYWLPFYVKLTHPDLSGPESDWLSTLFDVGGILGGIIAGLISDRLNARAVTCGSMLLIAVPFLFILRAYGGVSIGLYVVLLIVCGVLINGPYAIITTAVSSDLGTHPSLKANTNAKATVTAIIDGTGSLGAAMGPLLVGLITDRSSWENAFYFLMASCLASALLLSRLVFSESVRLRHRCQHWCNRDGTKPQEGMELRSMRPHVVEEDCSEYNDETNDETDLDQTPLTSSNNKLRSPLNSPSLDMDTVQDR